MYETSQDEIRNDEPKDDIRFLLTWIATGMLVYSLISGLLIWLLPFGPYSQYSVLVHSAIGVILSIPICRQMYRHWRRRHYFIEGSPKHLALFAVAVMGACLISGVYLFWKATVGGSGIGLAAQFHLYAGLVLGLVILWHLVPIFARYQKSQPTVRRAARHRNAGISGVIVVGFLCVTWILAATTDSDAVVFGLLAGDYEMPYGVDRPFWPSRAEIDNPPWKEQLAQDLAAIVATEKLQGLFDAAFSGMDNKHGPIERIAATLQTLELSAQQLQTAHTALQQASADMQSNGALNVTAYPRADSCGSAGCHNEIYNEWRPSAHGFAAEDTLFLRVQELLAESRGAAETRSCAGCHDPLALLSATRDGSPIADGALYQHDGVSCVSCHSITETTTAGNGSYRLTAPRPYLFADSESEFARWLNHFLIRSHPDQHNSDYGRALYRDSEFCAACHKQVPLPGVDTDVGLAQEQNEYDSWKNGRWYHEGEPEQTVECRECHMPLVASDDPASGDDEDSYRSPNDGKHRSHRVLASNMYIPTLQSLPGGKEQTERTIAWLRGEIDIPEIESKWVKGPVVDIQISAPDQIKPGELVNITLFLHNNKTGHDFPAGPLDLLESWIELTVEDNLGRTLLLLGDAKNENPALDAPVIYKADWYDRRGLPVEVHNLWDVVGASYKNTLESGSVEIADIAFQCPGIGRPRISESYSETGPGERKTDVVFSIDNSEIEELRVSARLLYRKANPEFLRRVFGVEEHVDAPVIELVSASHVIKVSGGQ